jgi:hypothetical protein
MPQLLLSRQRLQPWQQQILLLTLLQPHPASAAVAAAGCLRLAHPASIIN